MQDHPSNPDETPARVHSDDSLKPRGKLKIFLGPVAGVGKTYAMLEAALAQKAQGADVLIGYVETHGRAETETLVAGLEQLPPRVVEYHGARVRGLDLDAALARKPALILVDELAHTNVPGARHAKRWQDVEELLDAGIHVYTTVNVQHLESLNDVVEQITGFVVRETIPDSVLERADEVELIDLAPDDVLQRLREGKVYVPQPAERAGHHFFRKGNLMALRELALRRTADHVDELVQDYMRAHAIDHAWPINERLLVSIGPSPFAIQLLRAASRMAQALRAEWIAVYVETPEHTRLSQAARDLITQNLRLAEDLGALTFTLAGRDTSDELLRFAREHNATKIVVGKPRRARWHSILFSNVVQDLVRKSGDIDVYIITDAGEPVKTHARPRAAPHLAWLPYAGAIVVVSVCTALGALLSHVFGEANIVLLFLLGVVLVAARFGLGPSITASVLSVLAFDFFFINPRLSFAVADVQYLLTFGVMLVVATTISTLTARYQQFAEVAHERERRTAALYELSRDLAGTSSRERLAHIATQHVHRVFNSQVTILLPDHLGALTPTQTSAPAFELDTNEQGVAEWVFTHSQSAGLGTETLPGARALYMPLAASRKTIGVIGVQPADAKRFLAPEQFHLLETFANQTALALERNRLAEQARQAQVQIETERLRNSLLSSVSHDLRTPLAAITGASSTLLEGEMDVDADARRELAQTIYDEAERLNRLIRNLLDMTRIESGAIRVKPEWNSLEEVIGAALARLDSRLRGRTVTTCLPDTLPLVPFDSVLIEQVLINLLENAIKYTPPASPIEINASVVGEHVVVQVADHGPGIAPGDEERIFDKFYRAPGVTNSGGVGLGLTVCRGIVQAHDGKIWVANRAEGGAVFHVQLPREIKPNE
ncbi:MAG: sensor histidine kinase KdpD [Chloroflexi bacterium]|nr:sensor histidine kinase KdpD [Chloroflexota bacterium]